MKTAQFAIALACAATVASFGAPERAAAQERDLYLMLGGGIAEYVGEGSDFVNTGGELTAGVGINLHEVVSLEGEFIGAWASLCCGAGSVEGYSVMSGPRFLIPISSDGRSGLYVGGGLGIVYSRVDFNFGGWASETRFGFQLKSGVQYAVSDAIDLTFDVRYVATAKYSDEGVVGVGVGLRFYPGF